MSSGAPESVLASRRLAEMLSAGRHGDAIERTAFRADIMGAPVTFAVVGGALKFDRSFVTSFAFTVLLSLGSFLANLVQNDIW